MPTGRGRSLGAALADLFAQGGRPGGARSRYDRVGWRAQFSQMTKTPAGYAAMERAGLSATIETQRNWLSGRTEASGRNQELIRQAYQAMRGGFDRARYEHAKIDVHGRLTQGRDSRVRGFGKNPLRLQYPGDPATNWSRIEAEWNEEGDPDRLERLFVEDVVERVLGQGSHPWEFDGDDYKVVI